MNEISLQQLWKTVLGEIETEVSQANYFTLFKKTSLLSLNNNTATIATESNITLNFLQKRFGSLIKKTLDKHTGQNTTIIFLPKTVNNTGKEDQGPLFILNQQTEIAKKNIPLIPPLSRVRTDFAFETMAVSSSNQLAFVSAQTVAKNLGHSYNPLFIYGPTGVGKTHLMQAIANEVHNNSSDKKIIYITSEEFTNEVVEAIRSNDTARMKKRFRNADLLIIDDVQFIAGKDRVQEELFHTFNILIDKSSQIVLSSDRPPHEIQKLEKRLSSRFFSGLTVDVEPPDFELKTAILLIKSKKYGIDLSIDVAKHIAQATEDIRSLEGVLLRIITEAKNRQEEINLDLALKILHGRQQATSSHFHPDEIIKNVCNYYNIKHTLIKGPKRDASLVRIRQIIMFLLKHDLGLTFVEIGNLLGGRDHTTVMHGVEKVEKLIPVIPQLSLELVKIRQVMSGKNVHN